LLGPTREKEVAQTGKNWGERLGERAHRPKRWNGLKVSRPGVGGGTFGKTRQREGEGKVGVFNLLQERVGGVTINKK